TVAESAMESVAGPHPKININRPIMTIRPTRKIKPAVLARNLSISNSCLSSVYGFDCAPPAAVQPFVRPMAPQWPCIYPVDDVCLAAANLGCFTGNLLIHRAHNDNDSRQHRFQLHPLTALHRPGQLAPREQLAPLSTAPRSAHPPATGLSGQKQLLFR